jgi:AraC-like DNA-binding protein
MENLNLKINPYVRLAMQNEIGTSFYIDRVIWDHELIYIAGGEMKVTIDNKVYYCKEGDFIFLKPNIHHILENCCEKTLQPHVHFDFFEDELSERIYVSLKNKVDMTKEEKTWFRNDFLGEQGIELPTVIKMKNPYVAKNLLFQLIDEQNSKFAYSKLIVKGLLFELIGNILRDNSISNKELSDINLSKVDDLRKYMVMNIDKNLLLPDFAKYINMSPWYLIRIFNQYTGETPLKYFTNLRVARAKELIQYTTMSINEIADYLDFESHSNFSRWFKKNYGIAPKDLKQKLLPKNNNKM